GLMEQVAHVDPGFARLRSERAEAFVVRNARGIAELQERSIADTGIDAMMASRALSGMVSRMAYAVFVAGDGTGDVGEDSFEELVSVLTRLWANALRFPDRN
ncbi:MAG TPA: hypothetical protein VK028_06015, partial [Micromonosporaceae bacterium]|nr:hypothetical protein [Micromonosporaceae bacterium]